MGFFKKILSGCLTAVLNILNFIVPKKKNLILMYDAVGVGHSLIAMFKFLHDNGYVNYKVKYFVGPKDISKFRTKYKKYKNVSFTSSPFSTLIYRVRAKFFFSEQITSLYACRTPRRQISVHLWHGMALKKIGCEISSSSAFKKAHKTITYNLCYSQFGVEIMKRSFLIKDSQVMISQNPRCDLMFDSVDCFTPFKINKADYEKIVFWLPTFRKAKSRYDNSDINFPLLNMENFHTVNSYLAEKNILLVIKLHPVQDKIEFLNQSFSNIKTITNDDFFKTEVEFYQMIGQCDALVTDYSSVAYDFMLIDKPICYVIDDYDIYASKRGFNVDNALDFMPGHQVTEIEGYFKFFDDISDGKDVYRDERNKINCYVNEYRDNKNCKRVFDFCGIEKSKD